jgi:hypothetical protein
VGCWQWLSLAWAHYAIMPGVFAADGAPVTPPRDGGPHDLAREALRTGVAGGPGFEVVRKSRSNINDLLTR